MLRWGIILDRQLMFATNSEDTARRFMAMGGGFQVFDHTTGYYTYMDHKESDAIDLLIKEERNE
jgi:hypothetical protein